MRRSPAHRIFGALLALWFALAMGEPVSLHACPMHDGVAAAAAQHGGSHAAMHHQPAEHGKSARHSCTCIGQCCASSIAHPAQAPTVAARLVAARDPGLPDHRYTPVARALLLPWANGPPAV